MVNDPIMGLWMGYETPAFNTSFTQSIETWDVVTVTIALFIGVVNFSKSWYTNKKC